MSVTIILNGERHILERPIHVSALMERLKLPRNGIIVEHNREVLSRERLDQVLLEDGDELELIRLVGGG